MATLYLQHAAGALLLEALEEGPHQVVHVQQLELRLNDGLQNLRQEPGKGAVEETDRREELRPGKGSGTGGGVLAQLGCYAEL